MREEFKSIYGIKIKFWGIGIIFAGIIYIIYNYSEQIVGKIVMNIGGPSWVFTAILWGIMVILGLFVVVAGEDIISTVIEESDNLISWGISRLLGKQQEPFISSAEKEQKKALLKEQQEAARAAAKQAEQEREQHFKDIIERYYDTGETDDELSYAFGREGGYMHGEKAGIKRVYAAAYAEGEEDAEEDARRAARWRWEEEQRKKKEEKKNNSGWL